MSTQKRKFELYSRLQALGFTYEEAVSLRRIEMTLQRWGEAEANGDIERDEVTSRPFRRCGNYIQANDPRSIHFVADREAGALKRLKAIIKVRNLRESDNPSADNYIHAYHQGDCRGCNLYLLTSAQLPVVTDEQMRQHSGSWPLTSQATRLEWKLSTYYTRGLAVCA